MRDKELKIATFANGCFWCTEAVFKRIKGVERVFSGYTGGAIKNPTYREICTGRTGHAEAIQIHYDPIIVSFEGLLELFFATHDPTTLNRQGHDVGTQYRSGIFYNSETQKQQAETFIKLLTTKNVFDAPIVTEITSLDVFYEAEKEHHDYYDKNKEQRYCQLVISPKIDKLKTYFNTHLKETKNDAV